MCLRSRLLIRIGLHSPGAYGREYSRGAYVDKETTVFRPRRRFGPFFSNSTISVRRTLERAVALKLVYLRIAISQVLSEYSAIMFAKERGLKVQFPGKL
jgi:hypothetical protein